MLLGVYSVCVCVSVRVGVWYVCVCVCLGLCGVCVCCVECVCVCACVRCMCVVCVRVCACVLCVCGWCMRGVYVCVCVCVDFRYQEDTRFLQQPSISADRMCENFKYILLHSCRGIWYSCPTACNEAVDMRRKRELIILVYLQRVAYGSLMRQLGDSTKIFPLMHMSVL